MINYLDMREDRDISLGTKDDRIVFEHYEVVDRAAAIAKKNKLALDPAWFLGKAFIAFFHPHQHSPNSTCARENITYE